MAATGRGVRIAIVDSGVHAAHPHVNGVAGGVALDDLGRPHDDYVDRIGHGTAVTAAVREKAPDAELYAVKIFDRTLSTGIAALVAAIDWAAGVRVHLLNLSLGTARAEHEGSLAAAVAHASAQGVIVVAARDDEGIMYLPGSLPGVLAVQLDWDCPRDSYRFVALGGTTVFRASGHPRPIPGVPPERNLQGISFAVANMTGFAARALEPIIAATPRVSIDAIVRELCNRPSSALVSDCSDAADDGVSRS
jgi:subtilisin family serine protease